MFDTRRPGHSGREGSPDPRQGNLGSRDSPGYSWSDADGTVQRTGGSRLQRAGSESTVGDPPTSEPFGAHSVSTFCHPGAART